MEKSLRFKDKQLKQQQVPPTDRNANSPTTTTTTTTTTTESNENIVSYDNYMKLNYFEGRRQAAENGKSSENFRELFCDFPVSYETTEVITALQFPQKPNMPPTPYVEPPPPTPPPISQLPKRDNRLQQLLDTNISVSAPASPSRGKVVLSRKERKELNKLHKLLDRADTASSSINLGNLEATELMSAHAESSTYRGRVSELRNCIAKINTKVLFGSLNRNSHKSLTTNSIEFINTEACADLSPPQSSNFNNNDENYSEKLKNLPVRQRKTHTSHMENYCLFDPVDFINEKKLRNRSSVTQKETTLRDPLFSSRQNLEFLDEDVVPEIIYDNEEPATSGSYEHHNYFVIDPEDFEQEPTMNIGLPDKHSNENFAKCKVEISLQDDIIQVSKSCENILQRETEVNLISKSISQETKSNAPTEMLLECSTSSSAASALTSSSTSAASSQTTTTTLQRTKKKLSFLSLSPFRSQSAKCEQASENKVVVETNSDHKSVERAMSELVSCDHMLHLQQMLLNSNKENMRSRTVPIESNYVLFNPGPVPSRNVPYKVRKPRPLSTNSDADSGFLSPCSPDEMSSLKSNPAILVLQQCDSVQGYLEIYTDWANYYLERAKSKKRVIDLSADCRDGLLLADVIEAVTSFKVPDLVKKPKTQQHMYDNINSCLTILRAHAVGGLDNVTANDICSGRLKAVLALFFALSRYKQQAKQSTSSAANNSTAKCSSTTQTLKHEANSTQHATKPTPQLAGTTTRNSNANLIASNTSNEQCIQNGNEMVNRQIPSAYSKANGGTAIPLPATVMVQRRCPPDKVRPLPPTPNHTSSVPGLGKNGIEFTTSRPNSPPSNEHSAQENKTTNNNGLRPPTTNAGKTVGQSGIPPPSSVVAVPQQKHSMLDKLKLFNKEKHQQSATSTNRNQTQSKRTSSSSGFSSARSERSDSSLSLNDGHVSQIKPPTVSVTGNKAAKNNTKQSKLLLAQIKKDQMKANKDKADKKERSPARSLNKEDGSTTTPTPTTASSSECKTSTLNRTKQTTTNRFNEKHSAPTTKSNINTINSHTIAPKTSLIIPPTKTLTSPTGNATLPKPIAAIKGTSKLPQPPSCAGPAATSTPESKARSNETLKRENSDISSAQSNISTNINENLDQTQRSSPAHKNNSPAKKPTAAATQTEPSTASYYANAAAINNAQQHEQQNLDTNTHSSYNNLSAQEPTYINSGRLPPLKSALSPHLRKLDYNLSGHSGLLSPLQSPIRTLSQMTQSRPETPNSAVESSDNNSTNAAAAGKYYTVPTKIVGSIIYEEEKPVSVLPMRPLLRGYNSHVTLPTRGTHGNTSHFVTDFCENDIGQGYCSDGDVLRVSNSRIVGRQPSSNGTATASASASSSARFLDIDNGYLSEGGGPTTRNGNSNGKHFLTAFRHRTQLPTTIEERIRNSRGSLDSIGTQPPSSAGSQASSDNSTAAAALNMDATMNGHHHQQQQQMAHRLATRNGRDNWSKMPEPLNDHKSDRIDKSSSPSHSRRHVGSAGSPSKQSSASGRTKGVPPSFGYVKRTNGSATATAEQQNIVMMGAGRTAHISAVPRTAGGTRKVSGGTQTLPNDIKMATNTQHRSFSLTGPGASQLSQSIRERLSTGSHSLPKPGTDLHLYQHRLSNRTTKMLDGSLSDTQTYAEVRPEYSTYAMWLKHSNTAGSRLSEGESLENIQIGSPNMTRHGLKMLQQHQHRPAAVQQATATGNPSVDAAYVQSPRLNRSNSIRSTKSEKMYPNVLNRSGEAEIEPYYCLPVGSIAAAAHNGTISAQIAAAAAAAAAAGVSHVNAAGAAVSGGNGAAVAWSQPTSPSPVSRVFGGTLSPTTSAGVSNALSMMTGNHRLTYPKKNDEVHGSAASLLSGGSSLYGSAEERQANEIRRLKRELMDAREQVLSLSSQLSTNAHVVSAFEQSLSNMTSRLQHLTATAERKDGELTDMRQTIELLRKQSIQAGLTTAHMQSMGVQTQSQMDLGQHANAAQMTKQLQSTEVNGTTTAGVMQRHHSSDSMCSLNSISSNCSTHDKIKKKKGWLRSSFTKAFSRNAKISKTSRHAAGGHYGSDSRMAGASPARSNGHHAIKEENINSNNTTAHSSVNGNHTLLNSSPAKTVTLIDNAKPIDAIETEDHPVVEDLKKQLREKDLVLTDIRLEALSSASQLESLKETVNKMRAEMLSLKQNNERLQKLVTSRSLAGSEISLGHAISPSGSVNESRRFSLADTTGRPPIDLPKRLNEHIEEENIPPAPAPEPQQAMSPATHIDLTPPPPTLESLTNVSHLPLAEEMSDVTDGKKIAIACYLGQPESFRKYCEEMLETDTLYANSCILNENGEAEGSDMKSAFNVANLNEFVIAYTYISGKTTWQNLDYIVRKTFKDYVARIDPGTNLGLNTDSITSYHLGDAKRGPEMGFPELLPCGYIVGNVRNLYICLQGVGSLAFDSLIPRSIVHRYISLLTEHRRLILCGPSGTGKSYLARRLAEFLVARSVRGNPSEAIATFNVDHKSSKDLRQYLGHIAEQAAIANGASELPAIIILDNLHHASALGDIFSCLLSAGPAAKLPCIIGTMSQATCNTTNLQLHHNFRWVLTANHMEPVKGFLGRFLRRRLFQMELQTQKSQPELAAVLAWLPTVWQHINRFLEIHSSSDVTIGPRLFLTCPLDLKDSQIWFTDVWNYHLAPYLVEAVREGVQLYGRRGGPWNDPSIFIRNSYPWAYGADSVAPLRQIHAEDVGLEGVSGNNTDSQDPLLNMLMRLQEAANYSENQDPESDCASLDSNITPESSAGAE